MKGREHARNARTSSESVDNELIWHERAVRSRPEADAREARLDDRHHSASPDSVVHRPRGATLRVGRLERENTAWSMATGAMILSFAPLQFLVSTEDI